MSDLNIIHEKMSDFVSFPQFEFTLVIKSLKDLNLFLSKKKKKKSDLNMSCQTVSDLT